MRRLAALMAVAILAGGMLPANAVPVPVIASDNVELLSTIPLAGAISTAFDPTRPYMYVNTTEGITVFDISDPALPLPAGNLVLPHFENEGMAIGQRADGTTFVLIGIDLHGVNPGGPGQVTFDGSSVYVVDVTDPAAPTVRSWLNVTSSTHTIQCMNPECTVAWTSGVYGGGKMHAVDITNLSAPREIGQLSNINGSSYGVHQWTMVGEDTVVGTGGRGTGVYDVSNPLAPVPLNTTDQNGSLAPYNDFIQHNGDLKNADRLLALDLEDQLALADAKDFSIDNGNVLLVTEEDYDSPDCQGTVGIDAPEGGFSTWAVPYLDAGQHLVDNPELKGDAGTVYPLDTWNTELYDTGIATPAGALCSAHYFTTHEAGFVAQGWYGQGTRILDVRDPSDITQVGYFIAADTSETWHAYWVPERDADGAVTGHDTNIVYTNDAVRGIDVLQVELPETAPEDTPGVIAPILGAWLDPAAAPRLSSAGFGCRLPSSVPAAPTTDTTVGASVLGTTL